MWTNPSVCGFAGTTDPVELMVQRARGIALRAIDAGWPGPPFDPVALAEFLSIPTRPSDLVRDARTIPTDDEGILIEYNPNRPRGRVRFSVAHEIAHTLFQDCAEQVRNRLVHGQMTGDSWQLEALCNVGAAELVMPVATMAISPDGPVSIEALLNERGRFDVSMEALLIRVARASSAALLMFSATRLPSAKYRFDYTVRAPKLSTAVPSAGAVLPRTSAVAHCVSIGYTASGEEIWGHPGRRVHIECVGIPPYPGEAFPRVAGLAWVNYDTGGARQATPLIRYVRGDATQPRESPTLIVHVVNDSTPIWGGSGFAAALRRAYPSSQRSFRRWWTSTPGPRLGRVHIMEASNGVWVASLVAQHGYGPGVRRRLRYTALYDALEHAAAAAASHGLSVQMPRIGAGQGGGDWRVIEDLIRDSFGRTAGHVTVYDPPDTSAAPNRSTARGTL